MLQQELEVANDVIKDLKEASLNAILAKDSSTLDTNDIIDSVNSFGSDNIPTNKNGANETNPTPLFFALENAIRAQHC